MNSKNVKIFDETGCLSEDALLEYAHGKLDLHLRKQVEIHINECDFCRDAMEGISLLKNKESARSAVASLNARISGKNEVEQGGGKVIQMNMLRIAAAVLFFLVLGGGVIYLTLNPGFKNEMADAKKEEKTLAENKVVTKESALEVPDSAVSVTVLPAEEQNEVIQTAPPPASGEIAEKKDEGTIVSGTVENAKSVVTEELPAKEYETMTATGGASNATYYYQAAPATGNITTPSFYNDSIFRNKPADGYLADDISGFDNNNSLSEVTVASVESRSGKNKSADKKSKSVDGDAAGKAEYASKSKAESERKEKEEASRLAEEKSKADKAARTKAEEEEKLAAEMKRQETAQAQQAAAADYDALKVAEEKAEVDEARRNLEQQSEEGEKVYAFVEQMPQYPGGTEAMKKDIARMLTYPQSAKEQNISGTVLVNFVVAVNGRVTKVKVTKGVNKELDSEAVRVITSLKNFSPGMQEGKVVPVLMSVPVNFSLQ